MSGRKSYEGIGGSACKCISNKRNGSAGESRHFRGKGFELRKFLCLSNYSKIDFSSKLQILIFMSFAIYQTTLRSCICLRLKGEIMDMSSPVRRGLMG